MTFEDFIEENWDLVVESFELHYPYLDIKEVNPLWYDEVVNDLKDMYNNHLDLIQQESDAKHAMTEFALD